MKASTYKDMHLLDELTQQPHITQRELSKRIGAALGLTNLMLRRLAKKGYIKVTGTKRSRIRYLITPKGILEKTRLTYEFIQYSLQLYSQVRLSLRQQLAPLAASPQRRILLYGTGELAELAFLTISEMSLQLVGVVEIEPRRDSFLGYPVRTMQHILPDSYDHMVVMLPRGEDVIEHLVAAGVPRERIITLPGTIVARIPHDHLPVAKLSQQTDEAVVITS